MPLILWLQTIWSDDRTLSLLDNKFFRLNSGQNKQKITFMIADTLKAILSSLGLYTLYSLYSLELSCAQL